MISGYIAIVAVFYLRWYSIQGLICLMGWLPVYNKIQKVFHDYDVTTSLDFKKHCNATKGIGCEMNVHRKVQWKLPHYQLSASQLRCYVATIRVADKLGWKLAVGDISGSSSLGHWNSTLSSLHGVFVSERKLTSMIAYIITIGVLVFPVHLFGDTENTSTIWKYCCEWILCWGYIFMCSVKCQVFLCGDCSKYSCMMWFKLHCNIYGYFSKNIEHNKPYEWSQVYPYEICWQ